MKTKQILMAGALALSMVLLLIAKLFEYESE